MLLTVFCFLETGHVTTEMLLTSMGALLQHSACATVFGTEM